MLEKDKKIDTRVITFNTEKNISYLYRSDIS